MERYITLRNYRILHTDIVRFWIIVSLALCCVLITALSLIQDTGTLSTQLFYFPILYATYFYPRRGVLVAAVCAVAYEVLVYVHYFPDLFQLGAATGQAILFVCVAAAVGYFTEKIRISETRYRSIFEYSLLGIILFDKNSFAITLTNQQVEQMLGYTGDELKKIAFSALLCNPKEQHRFFGALGSSEDIKNFETCFLTKAREPCWVNLSWTRIDGNIVSCSVIDISTRKRALQVADDSSTQYRQLTESSPTGIVIVENQVIMFINPAFVAFLGYGETELAGRTLEFVVHPGDKARFLTFSQGWSAPSPAVDRAEFRFISKSGETKSGMLYFTPITRKNNPAGLINIVDNTDWERLKESVHLGNERRRGMISTVAHELRTPLQPIIGYLNLLLQDPKAFGVTEETRQILERCVKSVDRERQIIDQMLELSVLDSGDTELDYSVFRVADLVKTIVTDGGYAGKAEINNTIPPDLTFEADKEKIATVIDILLANGVTYSKSPKKIWIAYRGSESHPFHRLAIQDNGLGITDEKLDEIFSPVTPMDTKKPGQYTGGKGLSLSVAKKYIQMHGGYISVDSIVNVGSTFTLHIPKKRPDGVKPS
ncbi:MAG: PAS domain-containing sensor histidine kinase [Methanoregula sp.]|jgi:PAS domain S-box-containing protein